MLSQHIILRYITCKWNIRSLDVVLTWTKRWEMGWDHAVVLSSIQSCHHWSYCHATYLCLASHNTSTICGEIETFQASLTIRCHSQIRYIHLTGTLMQRWKASQAATITSDPKYVWQRHFHAERLLIWAKSSTRRPIVGPAICLSQMMDGTCAKKANLEITPRPGGLFSI